MSLLEMGSDFLCRYNIVVVQQKKSLWIRNLVTHAVSP